MPEACGLQVQVGSQVLENLLMCRIPSELGSAGRGESLRELRSRVGP